MNEESLDIDSVLRERELFQEKCGDDGKKDTPVPISNTEVKLLSADSSWGFPPVRVGRCHAFQYSAIAQLVVAHDC